MNIEKVKISFSVVLAVVIIPATNLFAQNPNELQYEFTQTDSTYTFKGSFKLQADPDCLLDISFHYDHIRELALGAKEVRLVHQAENWNQISYTYQRFIFFENRTIWHRILDRERQRVDFRLLSSKNNRAQMPRMIASSGFYEVKKEGEYCIMEYFQQCRITHNYLTKLYLNTAKKEAVRFMAYFSEYASTFCQGPTPLINQQIKENDF